MRWDPQPYIAIADALATLFKPTVEVVLHDIATDRILHIAGAFSRRRAGDSSLTEISDLRPFSEGIVGPYRKSNFDGRALRSISVVIRDGDQQPVAMLCVNLDVSVLGAARDLLQQLTLVEDIQSSVDAIFPSDWREQINQEIAAFLGSRNASLPGLVASDVIDLVRKLDRRGFFRIRKAADHIAVALGISRATLYKRLAAARQPSESINT